MKIKDISLFARKNVQEERRLVCVTAENGLKGYSEIYSQDAAYFIRKLKPSLIGRSVYKTNNILQDLNIHAIDAVSEAVGAVESAMWDILGKKMKQPVYNIMGGKVNYPRILCATGWDKDAKTLEDYVFGAKEVVAKGYTCLKITPLATLDETCFTQYRLLMRPVTDILTAVREAIGPDVNLCVDFDSRLTFDQSLRVMDEAGVREDIYYVANPAGYANLGGYKKLAMVTDIPVAVGRDTASTRELQQHMEGGNVSIMQFDAVRIGGLAEARYFASMEEAYYLKYAPLHFGGIPSLLGNIMIAAITPSVCHIEVDIAKLEADQAVYSTGHKIDNGVLVLDDNAFGLGFEPNMAEFKEA